MKKIAIISTFIMAAAFNSNAQMIKAKTSNISFFSKTAVEDIAAKTDKSTVVFDPTKKAIAFKVPITSFIFKDKLMRDHFNENYLESEKFPSATYEGTIQENIDFTKDGIYNVTVVGKLNIHGVTKQYTTKGTIAVKGKNVVMNSVFKVALVDHKIEIPKLVLKNIAEIIEVTVNAGFAL